MGFTRLFLALVVVLDHAAYSKWLGVDGHFAVMFFFMISGFYMALVLNTKYPEGSAFRFYIARFLRLWPTYIVAFAAVLLFVHEMNSIADKAPITDLYVKFVAVALVGYDTLTWFALDTVSGTIIATNDIRRTATVHPLDALPMMRQMWTLGIEIWFYVAAPFLARRPRRLILAFAGAYAIHVWISSNVGPLHPLRGRSAFNFFYLFFAGMIAYHVYAAVKPWFETIPSRNAAYAGVICFTAGPAFMILAEFVGAYAGHWGLMQDVTYLLFAMALIPIFGLTRNWRRDRAIGELSYPVYVIHMPIVTNWMIIEGRGDPMMAPVFLGIAIALGALLHFAVERPADKLRARFTDPLEHRPPAPVGGSAGVAQGY
ncbi:acyltransferase [Aminobacter sp. MDW-2]|uniref:acyltransferase family protein n=1 Tax=Aminobacter sp. MDW-2 TaxID=2666139 RepID=UPI0012B0C17E|nr:acyltransferase [Aminobacter sp. MDW-2]QNH36849.1 acyltransferase [Aminobacter sp. MDW-2]